MYWRIDIVDTEFNLKRMREVRIAYKTPLESEAVSAPGLKGSINLRIDARTRKLIDDAAAVLGKTRTEFMIESARTQAIDALLDQRMFVLEGEDYDAFVKVLDNPPAPGPKLKALMQRKPPWEK